MNKEQLYELAFGVAAVALAYAIYKQFQAKKQPEKAASTTTGTQGIAFDPYNPDYWTNGVFF